MSATALKSTVSAPVASHGLYNALKGYTVWFTARGDSVWVEWVRGNRILETRVMSRAEAREEWSAMRAFCKRVSDPTAPRKPTQAPKAECRDCNTHPATSGTLCRWCAFGRLHNL